MSRDFFTGVWTYRSFLNNPGKVDDLNKLLFGEGELYFQPGVVAGTIEGQLAFRSNPPQATDPRLSLVGSVETGTPFSVRFQGTGVPGTTAEGWIYDYVGYLVPEWSSGHGQKPALVGSVIRTVPHGGRPAGVVASFVAVARDFVQPRDVIPLAPKVVEMLATREHRFHHVIFHGTRGAWASLQKEKKDEIRKLGWQPGGSEERPAVRNGSPIVDNGSGEDFLFMHRQMIQEVDKMTKEATGQPVPRWVVIPPPGPLVIEPDFSSKPPRVPAVGNPDGYAVPAAWNTGDEVQTRRLASLKNDDFYWGRMKWWDRQFKDAQYLRTLTLGELGALLEFSVHNDMHMRWSPLPYDPQTGEPVPGGRPSNDIRTLWDDPKYDWLGEFYSSHVNPVFWRLHGWVDDRIEDWFHAHQAAHPGEIERATVQGVNWFKKGKWVHSNEPWAGPMEMHHGGHSGMPHYDLKKMIEVVNVLFGPLIRDAEKLSDAEKPRVAAAAADISVSAEPQTQVKPSTELLTWF
jgi:hypothetical protein